MKKRILGISLILVMLLLNIGCSKPDTSVNSSEDNEILKVEKNLFDVEVTLPTSLVGDSDDTLDEVVKTAGVTDITKNEDGSITMKMTKKAHKKLLSELRLSIDKSIEEFLSDKENYASFDSISRNEDMTEFNVTVDANTFNITEGMSALAFHIQGGLYQAFNAVPTEQAKVIVNFINKDTGDIIDSVDSSKQNDANAGSIDNTENEAKEIQDSTVNQTVDTDFSAVNMPVDGTYINSTNGGFPNTCEIRVAKESNNSFRFSIWQVIDENGNGTNNLIFMENIAVFDSADAATAVFRGQTYTVYFDCSNLYNIKLSGFDQATSISNNFLNMSAKFDSVYQD